MRSCGVLPLLLLVGATLINDIRGKACVINALAWGKDDINSPYVGYIVINGATVVNTSQAVASGHLGFYITTINPANCSAGPVSNYDIYNVGTSAATALAQYLGGLAEGTLIVGVTADTPNSADNSSLAPADSALQSIGISTPSSLVFRSKMAFLAWIGDLSNTFFQINPRYTYPVPMTFTFNDTNSAAAASSGSATCPPCPPPNPPCLVNLLAWGKDNPNNATWLGHIALNGNTVVDTSESVDLASGNKIGFYVTILNPANCTAGVVNNYDIYYGGTTAATALAQYLGGLAKGTVVLGVTADTPNSRNNQALAPALSALKSIGISTASSLVFRSQIAFIATIGDPSSTVYQLNGDATVPAQVIVSYR